MANFLPLEKVEEIRFLGMAGASVRQIGDILNISKVTVHTNLHKMQDRQGWQCSHGKSRFICGACRVNNKWHRIPTSDLEAQLRDYRDGSITKCTFAIGIGEPFPMFEWNFIAKMPGPALAGWRPLRTLRPSRLLCF